MKIFQLNDCEWWFAETLAEAYAEAERQTGETEANQREHFEPEEVPESIMDRPGEIRLSEDGETPVKLGSYREALALAMEGGVKSGLLCGTES